jgi:arylsulfatase A-like enzyme
MADKPDNSGAPDEKGKAPGPPFFKQRGGIWTVIGLLLVGGIAVTWWHKNFNQPDNGDKPETATAPRHLIVISIDTLRADHLGCYGYGRKTSPVIDKLAEEGVVFEQHFTCYPLTLPAHLTQFTGVSSLGHRVRDNLYHRLPDELGTLAEAMKADGFETGAFVSAHTMKAGSGIERGFDEYNDDGVRELEPGRITIAERKAPETLQLAGDWIAGQGADRFFCFIHLFDPHAPYVRRPGITDQFGEGDIAAYDGEIAFTDAELGKFIERLRTLDVLKDALVVITSDHGEGLGEHGELTHGYYCYDTTTHVPLIVRGAPGIKAGTRVKGIVRNYDLAPTLAEVMQLRDGRIKKQAHGVSLLPQMKEPENDPGYSAFIETHYAWLNANWAKIRGLRTRDGLTLFSGPDAIHLGADQGAPVKNDEAVRAARDEITRLMDASVLRKGELKPRESSAGSPYPGEVPVAQTFHKESLNDTANLPSPLSMVEALHIYQRAELALDEEKFAEVAQMLRAVLGDHPHFVMAQRLLAATLQAMMRGNPYAIGVEEGRRMTREALRALDAVVAHSLKHNQPEAVRAANLPRALLYAWLDETDKLLELADESNDPRLRWMWLLARYRTGEANLEEEAAQMFDELPFTGAAKESARRHLDAIQSNEPIRLAPWER